METLDLNDGFLMKGHYNYGQEFLIKIAGGLWLRVIAKTRTTDENGSKFTHFFIVTDKEEELKFLTGLTGIFFIWEIVIHLHHQIQTNKKFKLKTKTI